MKRISSALTTILVLITFIACNPLEKDQPEELSVNIDVSPIEFNDGVNSKTLDYIVSSDCDIVVRELKTVNASIEKHSGSGTITFSVNGEEDFNETAAIVFSNSAHQLTYKVQLSRTTVVPVIPETPTEPKVTKTLSFSFAEYARLFPVSLPRQSQYGYTISISEEDRNWISAKIGNSGYELDMYSLIILLKDNPGKEERTGTVTMSDNKTNETLEITISQIGTEMPGSMKRGLTSLYKALDGDNWDHNVNWCTDKPLYEWEGLSPYHEFIQDEVFHSHNLIYYGQKDQWAINMYDRKMHGIIPEDFWDICHLFHDIRIDYCNLEGTVLSDKVWHDNLWSISFSGTKVERTITDIVNNAITKAENVEKINLSGNHITGEIPENIIELKKLTDFDMGFNNLTGVIPENINKMTRLLNFDITGNEELGGTIPESLYEMTWLRTFRISGTKIGGTISSKIGQMKNLGVFDIDFCEFEGKIPEEFGTIPYFYYFSATGNYFTELPEFVRYRAIQHEWRIPGDMFAEHIPFLQRDKETGRPEDFPDKYYKYCHELPFPTWVRVKYGISSWTTCKIGEEKWPEWPYADDLQYPADEYFYDADTKTWRHPKLEYPAKEYYFDGKEWIHDVSCPWDQPYVYQD